MKYCPKCGFSMDSEAQFCGNCGFDFRSVNLSQGNAQPENAIQPEIARQPENVIQPFKQMPLQAEIHSQAQNASDAVQQQPSVETKKKKAIVPVILSILAVLIVGIGVLFTLEATDVINLIDGIGSDKKDSDSDEAVTDEDGNVVFSGETEKVWVITRIDDEDGNYRKISYDENGSQSVCISYGADGSERIREDFSYDVYGRLTEEVVINYETNDSAAYYMEYDKNGNLLKESLSGTIDEYDIEEINEYTYDENGNTLTEKTVMSFAGNVMTIMDVYTYDDDGNMLTKRTTVDDEENCVTKYEYSDGQRYKETEYKDEVMTNYTEYVYSDSGSLVTKIHYDGEGNETSRWENSYDSNERVVSKHYTSTDDFGTTKTEEYTYDDNGNILTFYDFDYYLKTDFYEYEYDVNNNKISEKKYETEDRELKYQYTYTWEEIEVPVENIDNIREAMSEY